MLKFLKIAHLIKGIRKIRGRYLRQCNMCHTTKSGHFCKSGNKYFYKFSLFRLCFFFFWTAFKRLPRRAAFRYHHALEQGDFAAFPFRVCQSWLPQVSVSAHQNLLLCSWGIPPAAGGCPASDLLCVLRFHGSPEGQHCAGNPWYVHNHRLEEEELSPSAGEPSLLTGG